MKKKLTVMLLIIVSFCCMIPSTVFADYAKNVEKLPDTDAKKNPYKIWSVAKAAGMSDEHAAGIIGNAEVEGGVDPTSIEGIFDERNSVNGPKKAAAIKDLPSYMRNTMIPMYINSGWAISGSTDKHGNTIPSTTGSGSAILTQSYIGVDGYHYPGVGLFGFTGPRTSKLFLWSKKYKQDWFSMETQLIYMLVKADPDGYIDGKADWIATEYMEETFTSPEAAAERWSIVFEGATVAMDARKAAAKKWYDEFKGDKGDLAYGNKILDGAKFPKTYNNNRQEIEDKSIVHDFSSAVINFDRSVGFLFDFDGKKEEQSKLAAEKLMKSVPNYIEDGSSAVKEKYSLFDLFGSDIHWYRYMGEATKPVQLLDHVWSASSQNLLDKLTLGDTVFYQSTRYLSTRVYNNRPPVLMIDDINEGKTDPRVTMISTGRFSGAGHVSSEIKLGIAKQITAFVSYLLGPAIFNQMNDILTNLFSGTIWPTVFVPFIMLLTAFAIVGFILSIVGKARKYAVGQAQTKDVLKRFFVGVFCLMIIFTFSAAPTYFINVVTKTATVLDNVFNSALTMKYKDDDVIGSTNGQNTVEAALWKTAIFEPWCRGQFGTAYSNLYTQFSDEPNKLPQSKLDDVSTLAVGEAGFSSATYTGDVVVPVGNKYIKNWAAYLYSCNSRYHIDQNYLDGTTKIPEVIQFPNMNTTAYNAEIAADTFRVIDAQMNISPQIYNDKTVQANYTDSRHVDYSYVSQSILMLTYAIMLFAALMPAILQKLYYLMLLMITGIRFIFHGVIELAKEDQGLVRFKEKFINYASNYFIAVIRLFVLVMLYTTLVGKDLIRSFLFIVLVFVTYSYNLEKVQKTIRSRPIKNSIDRLKKTVSNKR